MKFLKSEKGFGLLELIVAIAVLGAISATYLTASSTSYQAIAIANRESVAQRISQLKMEAVKKPYNADDDSGTPYHPPGPDYAQTDVAYADDADVPHDIDYPGYTITVTVGSVPGAGVDIQKITVTVKLYTNEIFTLVDYKVNR